VMHAKFMHELCSLLLHILTYLHVIFFIREYANAYLPFIEEVSSYIYKRKSICKAEE
jgi:hypothetical protein